MQHSSGMLNARPFDIQMIINIIMAHARPCFMPIPIFATFSLMDFVFCKRKRKVNESSEGCTDEVVN